MMKVSEQVMKCFRVIKERNYLVVVKSYSKDIDVANYHKATAKIHTRPPTNLHISISTMSLAAHLLPKLQNSKNLITAGGQEEETQRTQKLSNLLNDIYTEKLTMQQIIDSVTQTNNFTIIYFRINAVK